MSTQTLLRAGIAAGPLYILVGLAQALTREGFDVRRHALSQLSNGEAGWVQVANFLVCGLLVICGAIGVRRQIAGQRAGTWGPILLGVYGIGLIGAGVFPADPGRGFPLGTPDQVALSREGLLHFAFGGLGFYALVAACQVFARRFFAQRQRAWAICSVVTGVGFLASFIAVASGSTSATVMLLFYAAVAWIWLWHTALVARMARTP